MTTTAFGKYELLKKVGTGGMAELFLARQTGIEGFEKLIVIKRILPHLTDSRHSSRFVQMLLDEARLAAQLSHPNIIQIYDLGRVGDQYYIAMEYVNGVDLSQILKREMERDGHVPVEHVVKIATYVCEALSYAHKRTDNRGKPMRVVHRDVSPHNVLIAFDGGIKLTDFGIAKASSQMLKTQVGTIKGKWAYMSPEQCTGREVDHRSDIFSVGVLIYQMTTRMLPFAGKTEKSFMQSILNDPPAPPSAHRKGYPPGLEAILGRALARDPDRRYPDALQLQVALEGFLMEQKAVSNSTLISGYVRELFSDLVEIQARASPDGRTATVEGILDALDVSSSIRYAVPPLPAGPAKEPALSAEDAEEPTAPTRRIKRKPDGTYVLVTPSQVISRPWIRVKTAVKSLGSRARRLALGGIVLGLVLALIAIFAGRSPERTGAQGQYLPVMLIVDAWKQAAARADRPEPEPERPERLPKKPPRKKAVQPAGKGTLTVNSRPWSEVWVDGRKLGLTPLAYKELPAGRHRLVLHNPRLKLKKTLWISVHPGKTTELDVELR
jgi:serine/threonine protein kinase